MFVSFHYKIEFTNFFMFFFYIERFLTSTIILIFITKQKNSFSPFLK